MSKHRDHITNGEMSNSGNGTAWKVLGGVLAGAAAGAAAGILLAPHSGRKTRRRIADASKKAVDDVRGKVSDSLRNLTAEIDGHTTRAKAH